MYYFCVRMKNKLPVRIYGKTMEDNSDYLRINELPHKDKTYAIFGGNGKTLYFRKSIDALKFLATECWITDETRHLIDSDSISIEYVSVVDEYNILVYNSDENKFEEKNKLYHFIIELHDVDKNDVVFKCVKPHAMDCINETLKYLSSHSYNLSNGDMLYRDEFIDLLFRITTITFCSKNKKNPTLALYTINRCKVNDDGSYDKDF